MRRLGCPCLTRLPSVGPPWPSALQPAPSPPAVRPSATSSILYHLTSLSFQTAGRPERRRQRATIPAGMAGWSPQPIRSDSRSRTVASEVPATDGQQDRRATSKGSIRLCGPRFAPSGCGSDMDQSHSIGCSEWPAVNRHPHACVGTQRNQEEHRGTWGILPTMRHGCILCLVEPRSQPRN
jgi:hypothetical protein